MKWAMPNLFLATQPSPHTHTSKCNITAQDTNMGKLLYLGILTGRWPWYKKHPIWGNQRAVKIVNIIIDELKAQYLATRTFISSGCFKTKSTLANLATGGFTSDSDSKYWASCNPISIGTKYLNITWDAMLRIIAVSYTHLTLPTILLV